MEITEIIAELRKHGLMNGGSLGWHSGVCDEAADLLEKYSVLQNKRCENCGNYKLKNGRLRCEHECIDWDFDPGDTWLDVSGQDFCSYWKPREVAE